MINMYFIKYWFWTLKSIPSLWETKCYKKKRKEKRAQEKKKMIDCKQEVIFQKCLQKEKLQKKSFKLFAKILLKVFMQSQKK